MLETQDVKVRFGGAVALRGVDFRVGAGEIVGLVGENGAGKSTLVKVLTGVQKPTSGTVSVDGTAVQFDNPRDAGRHGVAAVHQDSQLFPSRRVWENLVVTSGRIPLRGPFVSRAAAADATRELLAKFNIEIDPYATVGELKPIERRLLEIARSLNGDPAFLFLDEPTAALEVAESRRLLTLISELRDQGTGVVLVSHHLDEVEKLADRVCVLRDGECVATLDRSKVDHDSLVEAMLGHSLNEASQLLPGQVGAEYAAVQNLRLADGSKPVDLKFRRGERIGVVGLVGSGTTALLEHFIGEGSATSDGILIEGQPTRINSPVAAIRDRIGYLSQDRSGAGALRSHSLNWNIGLASLRRHCSFGWRQRSQMRAEAAEMSERLSIRATGVDQPLAELSGGNQQKALIARWLAAGIEMLVVDEPTQGVDIGARADIARHLQQFATEGGVLLFASSDLHEIQTLSTRILAIYRGNVVADIDVGDEVPSHTQLLLHMTGAGTDTAARRVHGE